MSVVDRLVERYTKAVSLPWKEGRSAAERTWMLVYPPREERRIQARIDAFKIATQASGHGWLEIDFTDEFERWLVSRDYLEEHYKNPKNLLMMSDLLGEYLMERALSQSASRTAEDVVALTGLGSMYGLFSVSLLVEKVAKHIDGRVLAFFPGSRVGNNYRLLDAKDGWSYLAVPIDLSEERV